MSLPYVRTKDGFSAMVNNSPHEVSKTHSEFDVLWEAVQEGDEEKFMSHYKTSSKIEQGFSGTDVSVEDDRIRYKDMVVDNSLADKILRLIDSEKEENPARLVHFLDNLMQNPSKRAVDELYDFLRHEGLPITDDGHFLAYKAVRADFTDRYSGEIDNAPGSVVEMPRNQVSDNRSLSCASGLHVGAWEYAGPDGWYSSSDSRTVLVKVNPKDVVSVPNDHSHQKCRVSRYKVMEEVSGGNSKLSDDEIYEEEGDDSSGMPEFPGSENAKDMLLDYLWDDITVRNSPYTSPSETIEHVYPYREEQIDSKSDLYSWLYRAVEYVHDEDYDQHLDKLPINGETVRMIREELEFE